MQRRLVLSFVGVVIIGLLIAGLGTFFQAGLDRSAHSQERLLNTARSTTAFLSESLLDRRPISREKIRALTETARINEYGIIVFNPNTDQKTVISDLPSGVSENKLDLNSKTLFPSDVVPSGKIKTFWPEDSTSNILFF